MKNLLFSWESQTNIEYPYALPTLFLLLSLLLSAITWLRYKNQ